MTTHSLLPLLPCLHPEISPQTNYSCQNTTCLRVGFAGNLNKDTSYGLNCVPRKALLKSQPPGHQNVTLFENKPITHAIIKKERKQILSQLAWGGVEDSAFLKSWRMQIYGSTDCSVHGKALPDTCLKYQVRTISLCFVK